MSLQSVTARIANIQNRIGDSRSSAQDHTEFAGLLGDVQRHAGVSANDADPVGTSSLAGTTSYSSALLQSQQTSLVGRLTDGSSSTLGSMASSYDDLQELLGLLSGQTSATSTSQQVTSPVPVVHTGPNASVVEGYEVGSSYGMRIHPISGTERFHHGVDIGAPTGTPIRSFADGVVTFAGERGGYGKLVVVDHGNGYESRYAHQSELGVGVGDAVASGQMLGLVGSTGNSTGPHLHFELRVNGHSIDPTELLSEAGMTIRSES